MGNFIIRPIGVCVGFVYPAYASYKALESKTTEAAAQWLTYWTVFSLFTVVEYLAGFLIAWMPFYYLAKLAFILWLQLPQTKGAMLLYVRWVQPQLKLHEQEIDRVLEKGRHNAEINMRRVHERWAVAVFGKQNLVNRQMDREPLSLAEQGGSTTEKTA
eukprot:TRINITY_DN655_c0_g1_i3.p1 TRINITY_DN655_c0_g1~~TRINITY_DN655_c0_g1_i3.p1  ORF type:complete len:159 (-),score=21.39 TRINITY_DN655_c0_g1_i3:51-527(-)